MSSGSGETRGVNMMTNPAAVNGNGEEEFHDEKSSPLPGEPGSGSNSGSSKHTIIEFKSECSEIPVGKDADATSFRRQAIRVKRELVSFDTSASESNNAAEAEKQVNMSMMVQFPSEWTCPTCGSEFSTLSDLQSHQAACHFAMIRAHICDICQESFERKSDLNNHIVCHQVNRPHACRMCGSLFRKKGDLLSHMVTHQVDKPHKCATCGLEFQRHSSLTNHMKIHSYAAGRALIPSIYANTRANVTLIQTAAGAIKRNQPTWQVPERSTEPIPSFETLPVPGYAYYNNLASSNYTAFLASKMSSSATTLSSKHGSSEMSALIPPTVDTSNAFPSSSATQITCLPDIGQGAETEAHGELPADLQIPPEQFSVEQQTDFDGVPEVEGSECDNEALGSYLTVKNAGLLYGIKIEGEYNRQEVNCQQETMEECGEEEEEKLSATPPPSSAARTSPAPCPSRPADESASKPHMCHFCGIYFARQKAYLSHMRLHDDNWEATYQCPAPACGQTFPDCVSLNAHTSKCVRASTRDDELAAASPRDRQSAAAKQSFKHVCVTCDKRFATKQKLFRHMWIHRKKVFTCETCGDVFDERELLDKHRLELHPPNESTPYACQTCGKSFTSRQTLWEHGRVHGGSGSGAALLWCQECNKSFASRQGYQIHTRTHTGERPYGCRYCMKSFRDGGTLRKHERIHTGERPHVCPLCMRAFNQKVVLREHVRWVHAATATGEPPLRCVVCATSVPDREALCAHIVKHSDEMASEARGARATGARAPGARATGARATKGGKNVKARRPPRKSSKVLVQAVDGKLVSVDKGDLDQVANSTIETVVPPAAGAVAIATSGDSMEDSSRSTPGSPFHFPKMEPPQSTASAIDCSDAFMYPNDPKGAVGEDPDRAAANSQSPATAAALSPPEAGGGKLEEDRIPIQFPGFSEIASSVPQSVLPAEEPAPNVSIADIPDSQYHLMSQDVNLPSSLQTDIQDPMAYIQVVTEINCNPNDVMSQISLVSEGENEGQGSPENEYLATHQGCEGSAGLEEVLEAVPKDNTARIRCQVCHEEFAGTAALVQHVETHA